MSSVAAGSSKSTSRVMPPAKTLIIKVAPGVKTKYIIVLNVSCVIALFLKKEICAPLLSHKAHQGTFFTKVPPYYYVSALVTWLRQDIPDTFGHLRRLGEGSRPWSRRAWKDRRNTSGPGIRCRCTTRGCYNWSERCFLKDFKDMTKNICINSQNQDFDLQPTYVFPLAFVMLPDSLTPVSNCILLNQQN